MAAGCALLLAFGCVEQPEVAGGRDSAALTQDRVIPTGQPATPTGKHSAHAGYACITCHKCAGTVSFEAAVAGPSAAFDATTKNCSSVACHAVPAGDFTYYAWDWGCECTVAITVPYGGSAGATQPNWYAAAGSGCDGCHGYPPKYNGYAYVWHSGMHAISTSNGNTCQLCHPDATGAYVYGGLPSFVATSGGMITSCPTGTYCFAPGVATRPLHGNGIIDVSPRWGSRCFNCH